MKKLIILILFSAIPAFAQNVRYDNIAFAQGAKPLSGATITVCTSSGAGVPCTPLAPLCASSSDTSCTQPNPFTTDSNGNYGFWAKPGTYFYSITGTGITGLSGYITLASPNAAIKPAASDAVRYVSINGSDSQDCLSWGSACASVQGALTSLNGPGKIILGCSWFSVPSTITVTQGPIDIEGCAGDWNNGDTAQITGLKYTGSAGSDLLDIIPTSGRLSGIRLQNIALNGQSLARYVLNLQAQDTTSLINVKVEGGATAGWYIANSTGVTGLNVQITGINGITGLVIDWGSPDFNCFECAFDSVGGSAASTRELWIGGGGNHSISFYGPQFNLAASGSGQTPIGFITITGYDTSGADPWAGAPTGGIQVGSPRTVSFFGGGLAYANGGGNPNPVSQGADVLISGTATNNVNNVLFDNFDFNGGGSASTDTAAIEADRANFVEEIGGASFGHNETWLTTANPTNLLAVGEAHSTDTAFQSGSVTVNHLGFSGWNISAGLQLGTAGLSILSSGGGTITHQAPNTAGTFTITDPAATGNAVVDSATQTETNKTLTSPVIGTSIVPTAAGAVDLGSTSLPFGNLWVGTAGTNNFKFAPAATAQATTVTIADPALASVGLPLKIASGTATMTTASIGTLACGTTVTVAASGVLTTDSIIFSFNAAPAANPGELQVNSWPTANNVNFNYCNPTAGSVTPTAATLNWRVVR